MAKKQQCLDCGIFISINKKEMEIKREKKRKIEKEILQG
jgi:hypothetical protein